MSNIRDWLGAQLDYDEQIARAAAFRGSTWEQGDDPHDRSCVYTDRGGTVCHRDGPTEAEAAHIAEHDPARALRHVAAGRRILDRHAECGDIGWCDDANKGWEERRASGGPGCAEIADLASIYAHRDGYDPDWAPDPQ